MTNYAKRIRDLSPPAGVLAAYDRASVRHGFAQARDKAAEIAAQADAEIRSMRIVAARDREEIDKRGAEIEKMRIELAMMQPQREKGAAGEFFAWVSDFRTPTYVALFWAAFVSATVGALCAAVIDPNVFPVIAPIAIVSGGALAVAYRRHIKATKGDE